MNYVGMGRGKWGRSLFALFRRYLRLKEESLEDSADCYVPSLKR